MPDEARTARIRLYQQMRQTMSVAQMAAELGVREQVVQRWLRAYPVLTRQEEYEQNVRQAREMRDAGTDPIDIAYALGVARKTVISYLAHDAMEPRWRKRDKTRSRWRQARRMNIEIQRGGNGRNGDGSWQPTDGRGCPLCGAIRGGGHGGGCPNQGTQYDEKGQIIR